MSFLSQAALFLGAAMIAVPLSKRLGLGSVLGYWWRGGDRAVGTGLVTESTISCTSPNSASCCFSSSSGWSCSRRG